MKWMLMAAGAYLGLILLRNQQYSAATAQCGASAQCPGLTQAMANWAWLPNIGGGFQ